MLLEIMNVRSGAILDYNDGREAEDFLAVRLEGVADPEAIVKVDGVPAERIDKRFFGTALLKSQVNQVAVTSSSQYGELSQTLTLVWDKKAFKRYNFYIDDNSFFFTDLAKERPKRAFDHFYLAALKDIHRRYGTRITLNCFYHNAHFSFDMKDVPDCYRSEFEDNSDWLRLSFHAYSEFPDRPYQHAPAEKLAADYDLVKKEIIRFAGEKSFIAPVCIHWAMLNPDTFHILHERGVCILDGEFLCGKTYMGEADTKSRIADIGYFYEKDVTEYIWARKIFYDRFHDLYLSRCDVTVNMVPLNEVRTAVQTAAHNQNCNSVLSLSSHEQYSFPYYSNFLPDHLARLDAACLAASELGYAPVFFTEGLFGSKVREKN